MKLDLFSVVFHLLTLDLFLFGGAPNTDAGRP